MNRASVFQQAKPDNYFPSGNRVLQRKGDFGNRELVRSQNGQRQLTDNNSTLKSGPKDAVENRTGLSDSLKGGLESLSGMDLSGVRVHRNSSEPARVNALAYTQGQNIYMGRGQEKHLPHEGWHAVQQMQGRVLPTIQGKGVTINDNDSLEREADEMGDKAMVAGRLVNYSKPLLAERPSHTVVQRTPDDKSPPELSSLESIYSEEHSVIRNAMGARVLNNLAEGVIFYNSGHVRAVGLSESEFFAGPFNTDMGNIFYVYRITEVNEETDTYSVERSITIHGWSPVSSGEIKSKVAKWRGNETPLEFKTTPLMPTISNEVTDTDKSGTADNRSGSTPSQSITPVEPVVLTGPRRKWLKAGRGGMKREIVSLFSSIEKLKGLRITAWEKNTKIKDPKPARDALEIAVGVLGYGFGGMIGGKLVKGMAHGILVDFIEESAVKATDKAVTAIFKNSVKPAKDLLTEATKKGLEESSKASVSAALAGKGSLVDAYVESARLQANVDERVQTREFNATADAKHTDLALADMVLIFQKLYDVLLSDPSSFLQQLTIALIRLQDEVVIEKGSKNYGGDREKFLKEDPAFDESNERKGNVVLLGGGTTNSLGSWKSPNFSFGIHGIATSLNNATLGELKGAIIKDLPIDFAFRLWAFTPNRGFFGDVFAKAWFNKRANGTVVVDFDQSTPGSNVGNGVEWLARYHLNTSKDLKKTERNDAAPKGARKVYDNLKNKKINNVRNSDIF